MPIAETSITTVEQVGVKRKSLEDYRCIVGDGLIDEIHLLAKRLKGTRLLHVNATASGGGVAELLNSLVPLERDCGLEVEWRVLCMHEGLFKTTKNFHNALQGAQFTLTPATKQVYLERNQHCADMLASGYDIVIIHDPQPAALPQFVNFSGSRWIWRCHIDTSTPNTGRWDFLLPFIPAYDVAVFTMPAVVRPVVAGVAAAGKPVVGYGERHKVTLERLYGLAVGLWVIGIVTYGVVTAFLASWFWTLAGTGGLIVVSFAFYGLFKSGALGLLWQAAVAAKHGVCPPVEIIRG